MFYSTSSSIVRLSIALLSAMSAPAVAIGGQLGQTVEEANSQTQLAQRWLSGELESYGDFDISYDGPPITIRVTSHLPEMADLVQVQIKGWDILEKMSGGKIIAETFWSGSVHGVAEGRDAVRTGLSDFAPCLVLYHPTDYDLATGLGLPFLFNNAHEAAAAAEQLYGEFLKEEFESWGVLLARYSFTSPYHLYNNRPVRTLQDMQGLKVRGSGMQGQIMRELGAVPVGLPASDIYQAMQRGLLDAAPLSDSSGPTFNVGEVAQYRTENGFNLVPFENCLSVKWYESLPEDMKVVFDAWSRQMVIVEATINYDLGDINSLNEMISEGLVLIDLDDAELARWQEQLEPMVDAWIAERESAGFPAQQMVDRARELSARYAEMTPDEILEEAIDDPVADILN